MGIWEAKFKVDCNWCRETKSSVCGTISENRQVGIVLLSIMAHAGWLPSPYCCVRVVSSCFVDGGEGETTRVRTSGIMAHWSCYQVCLCVV